MPSGLRLVDFSDRELLHLLIDAADGEGWATSKDVAALPGMKWLRDQHPRPHQPIAQRFSWLWRFDILEREHLIDEHGHPRYISGDPERPKWGQRWRLTEVGEAFALGELTQAQQRNLERMLTEPGKLLMTTRWLTTVARGAKLAEQKMLTREWKYGTAKERLTNGRRR